MSISMRFLHPSLFYFIFSNVTTTPVLKAFPEAYSERERMVEQEERHSRLDTPIFVGQLSFPGLPTVVHFFEPRYIFYLPWTKPANAVLDIASCSGAVFKHLILIRPLG